MFNDPDFEEKKTSLSTHLNFKDQSKIKQNFSKTKKNKETPLCFRRKKQIPELNNILVIKVSVLIFLEY